MIQILKSCLRFLKKGLVYKIVFLAVFFGVGLAPMVMPQTVFAQVVKSQPAASASTTTSTKDTKNTLESKTRGLNALLKLLYVILWPLLGIAGLTLDNSMVYGSYLNLDAPLWQFWNIMKNFANFALGFLVLRSIIRSIFATWDQGGYSFTDEKGPFGVIKKALISGVLIQMSWFLLAAVIDLSTIATYAIGGLPLSVMQGSDDIGKKPILGVHSNLNLKEYENLHEYTDSFEIWYSYGQAHKISKCKINDGKYIVGRERGEAEYDNSGLTADIAPGGGKYQLCFYQSSLYAYVEHESLSGKINSDYQNQLETLWGSNQKTAAFVGSQPDYSQCASYTYLDYQNEDANKKIIDVLSPKRADGILAKYGVNLNNCESKILGKAEGANRLLGQRDQYGGMTMNNMLTKLEGLSGPLVTMYASLMNFTEISNVPKQGENIGAMWIELLIKTIFALALILPLAMMALVLIVRVGILWLVIAFMPFLILAWTFFKESAEKLLEKFKIPTPGELIKLIFAPVIMVFAVSVSLIFMTALNNTLANDAKQHAFFENLGIYDTASGEVNILNLVTNEMQGDTTGSDMGNILTFLSWIITNLFGVGIVWALLFTSIKFTKLGGGMEIVNNANKLLGQTLGAIPLMRVDNGDGTSTGVGFTAMSTALPKALNKRIEKSTREEEEALDKFFNKKQKDKEVSAFDVREYQRRIANGEDDDAVAKSLGKDRTTIEASSFFTSNQAAIAELENHEKTKGRKIEASDVLNLSKGAVEQALNKKSLQLNDQSVVRTNDGLYTVVQHNTMSGQRYELVEVPDTNNKLKEFEDNLKSDVTLSEEDRYKKLKEELLADNKIKEEDYIKQLEAKKAELETAYGVPASNSNTTSPTGTSGATGGGGGTPP